MEHILNVICLGLFVDLFLYLDFIITPTTFILESLLFNFVSCPYFFRRKSYHFSNLRAGPIDTFMLAIHKRFGLSVKNSTIIIEGGALLVGLLLGGPIGIGTIVVCLLMGPLIEFFLTILNGQRDRLRPMFQKIKVPHNT